jgi:cytochrome c oxidase subunit 3
MTFKRSEAQINLASNIVIISMAMLFATLFMGYAIYRSSAPVWPPYGTQKVSLLLPSLSTVILFVSSFFCHQVLVHSKKADFKKAHFNLNITITLGLGFMILQGLLWSQMKGAGLYVSSGIFASLTYAFTWIHFAHMVLGVLALFYLKKVLRPQTQNILTKTSSVGNFWYFLEIVWIIMFITLFVF